MYPYLPRCKHARTPTPALRARMQDLLHGHDKRMNLDVRRVLSLAFGIRPIAWWCECVCVCVWGGVNRCIGQTRAGNAGARTMAFIWPWHCMHPQFPMHPHGYCIRPQRPHDLLSPAYTFQHLSLCDPQHPCASLRAGGGSTCQFDHHPRPLAPK